MVKDPRHVLRTIKNANKAIDLGPFSAGIDLRRQHPRQILTSKVDPRAVRVLFQDYLIPRA